MLTEQPGTALGTGGTSANETTPQTPTHGAYIVMGGETDNKH